MKYILYIIIFILISHKVNSQITYIPDPIFEQELISQNIDSDGILNGQILTSDALAITSLTITFNSNTGEFIYDLTGIQDFINLEYLTVNGTMIDEINLSTLSSLKYLNCVDNMLTQIDVSNNTLLEYLDITSGGDVYPMNLFNEIDLSNNPNLHTLRASGISKINLSNNNNNENMFIYISCSYCFHYPIDYIINNVCIKVDNPEFAQNNLYPYSEWIIYHQNVAYNFTDNIEECSLKVNSISENRIKIHPNPTSDNLYIETTDSVIEKIVIFDLLGRVVLEQNKLNIISVSKLKKGNYLLKIVTNNGIQTKKILVK